MALKLVYLRKCDKEGCDGRHRAEHEIEAHHSIPRIPTLPDNWFRKDGMDFCPRHRERRFVADR